MEQHNLTHPLNRFSKSAVYLPLIVFQLYLIVTLIIYVLGPINFNTHNDLIFWMLIITYQFSFFLGYYFSTKSSNLKPQKIKRFRLSSTKFYLLCIFSVLAAMIAYKNIMISPNLIPYELFSDIKRGISEPGLVYTERMSLQYQTGGHRWLNILYFPISFLTSVFVVIVILYWHHFNFFKKIVSLTIIMFFVMVGIASGTNKPIFDVVILLSASLAMFFSLNYIKYKKFYVRQRLFFTVLLIVMFLLAIFMFGSIMSTRGGDYSYFASTSPLGDITTLVLYQELDGILDVYAYAFVWLNYYLVQGYYGFSLAISESFTTTFGFGNSPFLMRQFEILTGIDLVERTYQYKVDDYWGRTAQWHSFYGQMANDIHFIGVAFLMLLLGFYLSKIWISILVSDSFYGKLLIPLFVLFMVFIPANNQVLGFMGTFSYFVIVSFLWLFESKK